MTVPGPPTPTQRSSVAVAIRGREYAFRGVDSLTREELGELAAIGPWAARGAPRPLTRVRVASGTGRMLRLLCPTLERRVLRRLSTDERTRILRAYAAAVRNGG